MTSNIKTYEDLVREKEELEVLLQLQRSHIRYDMRALKEEFRPARQAVSFMGKMFTKDKHSPLLSAGANMVVDLVVKKLLLGRAGWMTKLIVPFLLKNYSSHILAEKKSGIFAKLRSLFSRNGTHHTRTDIDLGKR